MPSSSCLAEGLPAPPMLTEPNQKLDGKEVWKSSLQGIAPSDTEQQGCFMDHLICAATEGSILRRALCCHALEMLNTFWTTGFAFLFCTGPENFIYGPAEQSVEGQTWSWEQKGKCQVCYVLLNCSAQSLRQLKLLSNARSCQGNHKLARCW